MSVWVIETKGNVERDIGIYSWIIFHPVSNRKLFNKTTDLYVYIEPNIDLAKNMFIFFNNCRNEIFEILFNLKSDSRNWKIILNKLDKCKVFHVYFMSV